MDQPQHLREKLVARLQPEPRVALGIGRVILVAHQRKDHLARDLELDGLEVRAGVVRLAILLLELTWPREAGRADLVADARLDEHRGRLVLRLDAQRLHLARCRP